MSVSRPDDSIRLRGVRGFGHHGVFEHERREGQEFSVDLVLRTDTRVAAASDDLADTVDYGVIARDVHGVLTGEPVNLIETLAGRIADVCLAHPRIAAVEVTVHKPSAPITVPFDDVTVCIVRGAGESVVRSAEESVVSSADESVVRSADESVVRNAEESVAHGADELAPGNVGPDGSGARA